MSPTPSSCALALPRNLLSDIKAWPFLLSVQAGMSMGELSSCQEHNMRARLGTASIHSGFCLFDENLLTDIEDLIHLSWHLLGADTIPRRASCGQRMYKLMTHPHDNLEKPLESTLPPHTFIIEGTQRRACLAVSLQQV